jgi:dolichyl-phosphate-mannose--protein O-mannosyl transferase
MERGHFGPTMPNHPNLRNILVHASMKVFGTGAFGLRGFSLLLGVLGIPVLGLMAYRITSNVTASCLAAFFLAVDPVHITFSRQAIQEVHTAFFFMLGTVLAVTGVKSEKGGELVLLPLAGVSFGLGLASKAHALFPLLVCLAFAALNCRRSGTPWRDLVFAALSLGLLPLSVYMLTYAPWFGRGYGLSDWVFMQRELLGIMTAHAGNPMDSMLDTRPWQWFMSPLVGYGNFTHSGGRPFVTIAVGNPLVWMLVLPSSAWMLYRRTPGGWLLLALFFTAYLPLAFTTRPIWVLSSIAVTPFAFAIVGRAVSDVAKRMGMNALYAYVVLTLAISMALFPLSVGKALDYGYLGAIVQRHNPH